MESTSGSDSETDPPTKLVSDETYIVMSYVVLVVFVLVLLLICVFNIMEKKRLARVENRPLNDAENRKKRRTML